MDELLAPEVVVTPEVAEDQPELSLREQIDSAAKEVSGRERDDKGRFAPKGAEEPVAEVTPAATKPAAAPAEGAAPTQQAAEQPARPTLAPNAWSTAAKAAWINADPVLKAEIAKREADVHREFTRQDNDRNFGKQIKSVIDPYLHIIQAEGGEPVRAVRDLLETAKQLRTADPHTKAQLIGTVCRQYGVDLGLLGVQGQQTQNVDPGVQNLYTRIQQLESSLSQRDAQAQNQELAQHQGAIAAFAADPANEHFEALRPAMSALLQSGQATTLQEAYDAAMWARPDTRSSLIAQQQQATEAKRVADATAKANAARRASGSVVGSPGLGQPMDPRAGNRSIADELKAAMAAHRL